MLHQLRNSEFHLRPAQIQRIIEKAGSFRNSCLVKLLALTGMRRAELVALDAPDLDFAEQIIHVRNGKGGKARIIPMLKNLADDLFGLIAVRKSGPVFLSRTGRRLTLRQVNWIVAKAGVQAKVKNPNPKYRNVNCHLFRHSFAREWKKRRGSIESLSTILGHASVKTTLDVYGTEGLGDVQRNYEHIMSKIWRTEPPLSKSRWRVFQPL